MVISVNLHMDLTKLLEFPQMNTLERKNAASSGTLMCVRMVEDASLDIVMFK
jgi:hypothetical protein